MTTIAQYKAMCRTHDWFYMYSDDGQVYKNGHHNELLLKQIAKESSYHQKIFDGWSDFKFHDGPDPDKPPLQASGKAAEGDPTQGELLG